ncbi:hypothetical protein EVAR_42024_1 [Eumeta japonica]|uniref:Histone-lysine N-methyltransferase SETMAR n=1 Tax=Eumeta variegata TaxID=151549 RepID=A0A4C1YAA0_EUMVA|nr:hypothetical protein EVAR_42024_1 [Eumeta japonica]
MFSIPKRAFLQDDNVRPHTAKVTRDKIKELSGKELLPHSAFRARLPPSDFYLLRSMAKFFCGKSLSPKEMLKMKDVKACIALRAQRTGHYRVTDKSSRSTQQPQSRDKSRY